MHTYQTSSVASSLSSVTRTQEQETNLGTSDEKEFIPQRIGMTRPMGMYVCMYVCMQKQIHMSATGHDKSYRHVCMCVCMHAKEFIPRLIGMTRHIGMYVCMYTHVYVCKNEFISQQAAMTRPLDMYVCICMCACMRPFRVQIKHARM